MRGGPYHLGLIGYPLGHSRSPRLHSAAMAYYHLEGEYRLFPVPPLPEGQSQIQALMQQMRSSELHGLNITIPHKSSVLPYVDRLTGVAQSVGAVNTLYLDSHSRLIGDNTDVPGFLTDLSNLLSKDAAPESALVLGAGGSARAVVYGLASAGWQVHVLARRPEQAAKIIADLRIVNKYRDDQLLPGSLTPDTLIKLSAGCRLIVNATPLGMDPHPEGNPWPAGVPFPGSACIYDLVYNPVVTEFVRCAQQAGLPIRTGGGMLASQAALAFSLWTGLEPPFETMLETICAI